MSDGSSADAASVLQSQTPVSTSGSNVIGPRSPQISPNSHPQATPALKLVASLRNSKPNVIPIAVLTSRCTNKPCQLLKLVSSPATLVNTPVFSIIGLATKPPANPATAPHPSDCNTRRPGPCGSMVYGHQGHAPGRRAQTFRSHDCESE